MTRHERYNKTLKKIDALEKAGKVFVIQPKTPPQVSRLSKNRAELIALHDQGMKYTEELLPKLLEFVSG
jgi:predicted patatin/cPLA2 family phospholipase